MALLIGIHTFQDQLGVPWVLNGGTLRVSLLGRAGEGVFAKGESRMLASGEEETLLYSPSDAGHRERVQIRFNFANEYTAELRINSEPNNYKLWDLEALYSLEKIDDHFASPMSTQPQPSQQLKMS